MPSPLRLHLAAVALAVAAVARAQPFPGEPSDPPEERVPAPEVRTTAAPAKPSTDSEGDGDGKKPKAPPAKSPPVEPASGASAAAGSAPRAPPEPDPGRKPGDPEIPPELTAPPRVDHASGPPSPFSKEETWLDVGHAFIEQRIFYPVVRFDRFFSDERDLEAARSRSFLRLRTEAHFRQDGSPAYGVNLRADLKLPGLNQRLEELRLVISGESDDTAGALFPGSDGRTPINSARVGRADAELRYGFWRGLLSRADVGAGVLLRLPPGVFGRVRFRTAIPVRDWFLTRYSQSVFWRTNTRFGTGAAAEVERPLGPASLARIGGAAELTEVSRGVEWTSETALLRSIGPKRAISVGAGMEGATDSPVSVEKYRLFTRLRRDVWRRWIFFEVEPEVGWPWDPARRRHRAFAATFRLEVQFQGNEGIPADAAARREPDDPDPGTAAASR